MFGVSQTGPKGEPVVGSEAVEVVVLVVVGSAVGGAGEDPSRHTEKKVVGLGAPTLTWQEQRGMDVVTSTGHPHSLHE